MSSVGFAEEDEGKKRLFINYNNKFAKLGRVSLSQRLYPKDHVSEELQIISGVSEQ